jgi:hypothetical protein
MAAGCVPIAPRRYNYPALVPEELHGRLLYETEGELRDRLRELLMGPLPRREALQASAARFGWEWGGPRWAEALGALAGRQETGHG